MGALSQVPGPHGEMKGQQAWFAREMQAQELQDFGVGVLMGRKDCLWSLTVLRLHR